MARLSIPLAHLEEARPVLLRHGQEEVLVCMIEGQYYAVSARCTHAQESLACGRVSGTEIHCPAHGARFDLRTGACTAAPANHPLQRFPVLLEGGKVWIDI